jgi:hypothetical protein
MNHQLVRTYAHLTDCEQPTWKRLAAGAVFLTAVVIGAAIVNLIVFAIASSLGAVSKSVDLVGNDGLSAGLIIATTAIGISLAATTFGVIGWLSRRPVRTFRIVATVVLVLSFVPVLGLPGASASMTITLLCMHLVAWAACVAFIPRLAHRPDRPED